MEDENIDVLEEYIKLHVVEVQILMRDIREKQEHLQTLKLILKSMLFQENKYYLDESREEERKKILHFTEIQY